MTFDLMSSNTDISESHRRDVKDLCSHLEAADSKSNAHHERVAIVCSNYDGLLTNCDGVANFFSKFTHVSITLFIFLGGKTGDKWERHDMADIIHAIADVKSRRYKNLTPAHDLVLKWVAIAIDKEM